MQDNETFLITGGYGLLGSRLIAQLCREIPGSHIIVVSRGGKKESWGACSNIRQIYGDLRDSELWDELPTGITHIFHLAAVIPWQREDKNKAKIVTNNLLPLAHLIEHSIKWSNLKQVIYSSSISVYASTHHLIHENSIQIPVDIYGSSKLAGEKLLLCLETRGIKVVSLRYSSLYAYGQFPGTVLPIMINSAIKNQEIFVYGKGNRVQDFLHCDDAANANLLAYRENIQGVFNIGSGVPVSMTELAQTISSIFTNKRARVTHLTAEKEDGPGSRIDISRARQELNYQPMIQIESGLVRLKKEMESAQQ